MGAWISRNRTIIPACDVGLDRLEELVKETTHLETIGAYKIGAALALEYGLPRVVQTVRKHSSKPLIYDHQKGGTDIPATGAKFMSTLSVSQLDAVILFPMSGPRTLTSWVNDAKDRHLRVIVGGLMTHPQYLASENGYIEDTAAERIYIEAAKIGVTDFVVPGTRPEFISRIKQRLGEAGVEPTFFAPGFIAQGGSLSEAAKVAGHRWHAIVGRAIYEAPDMARAAQSLAASL